ncbi:MAG: hypothetical protein OT477_06060 [Chloroflexi bacterium]|nr:hypothetical protein [Chloroflexota bacterium]
MDKKTFYPHIFSLATAGVKHHGYQDYIFHPVKTDFIGDSGLGKSMIADMLQLIFVGANEFKPGTDNPSRIPKNMILSGQGHSGLGYIFLNLKTSSQAYLIVGVYIETSSNRVRHFIVQAGYNWEGENSLTPFAEPLSYKATITDEKLLPIDDFIEKMGNLRGEHRRIVKVFNSINSYHEILAQNHILPIDFSGDTQKLKDYAHILYSLARGKSKKPLQDDSEKLKSFLFGDQDAQNLLQKFKSEDKSWLYSLEDYERNKNEIKNVNEIGSKLKELGILEVKQYHAQKLYLDTQTNYYYHKYANLDKEIAQISTDLVQAQWKYFMVKNKEVELELTNRQEELTKYKQDIQNLKDWQAQLQTNSEENKELAKMLEGSEKKHKESLENIEKIKQVETWLSVYNYSLINLKNQFSAQLHNREEKKALQEFTNRLKEKGLFAVFETSIWSKNYEQAKLETKETLKQLEKQLQFLELLRTFSNLENPDSLARWVLERGESLSQVEESILLHFQGLPRQEPERAEGNRYLPVPEKLFKEIEIEGQDERGFWLGLGGIQEFITLKPQHLSNLQSNDYKVELDNLLHDSEAKYQSLLREKGILEQLQDFLGYESAKERIELFKARHDIEKFSIDESLPESQKEFEDFMLAYEHSEEIKRIYDLRNTEYQFAKAKKIASDKEKSKLEANIEIVNDKLKTKNKSQLVEAVNEKETEILYLKKKLEELNIDYEKDSFKDELEAIPSEKLRSFSDDFLSKKTDLQSTINQKQTELSSIKSNLQQALEAYESALKGTFTASDNESDISHIEAKKEFDQLKSNFVARYNIIAETFAKNDYYKLKDSTDIGLLAYTLLPKIFPSPEIERSNITENITNYLQSINEKNRQINQGRIDFLIDIFEKVRTYHHHYLSEVLKELRKFFRSEGAQITGGYQVSLTTLENYSIEWIGDLRHSLDAWKQKQMSMFSNFSEDASLDEIIFETFKKHTSKSKAPDIKDILDPKSYFDLKFELKNASNSTQGSTGQAYTAIALLCIARLSLIEQRRGSRGIRFMPIDEAEGIGSNYETLRKLASLYSYQIVSMSIRNVEGVKEEEQNTYMLVPNRDETEGINYSPYPILTYGHEQFELWSEENV